MMTQEKINYYMTRAESLESNSYDPDSKTGCCIVGIKGGDDNYHTLSVGWNNMPLYYNDSFPWSKGKSIKDPESKYPYIIHAEENALLNCNNNLHDYDELYAFVTYEPCASCTRLLATAGIEKIYYRKPNTRITATDRIVIDKICQVLSIEIIKVEQ